MDHDCLRTENGHHHRAICPNEDLRGYTRARDMHGDPPRRGASTEKGLRNDRAGVDIALS